MPRAALDCRETESETELCSRSGNVDLTRSRIIGNQGSDDMPQDSPPQYRVLVEKDVPMTTRDGLTLRADVYRPDALGRFPVLLSRLPYNKNLRPRPGDIDYFVERGYGVIMQDTRGRFSSEGEEYYALIWEMADGYDAALCCMDRQPPAASGRL